MSSNIKKVGFFNPIYHQAGSSKNEKLAWLGRCVEGYFDVGQSAYSIPPYPHLVKDGLVGVVKEEPLKRSTLEVVLRVTFIALKAISYLSLILPLGMVIGKVIYRTSNRFSVQKKISGEEVKKVLSLAAQALQERPPDWFSCDGPVDLPQVKYFDDMSKKRDQLTTILSDSFISFNAEQCKELKDAVALLDACIHKLTEEIACNRDSIIGHISDNQRAVFDALNQLDGKELHAKAAEEWQNCQQVDTFLHQFQESLGVKKIDGEWRTGEGMALYHHPLASRLSKVIVPRGIINLGATCFMNASIQALIANPDFRARIKSQDQPIYEELKNKMAQNLQNAIPSIDAQKMVDELFAVWNGLTVEELRGRAGIMNGEWVKKGIKELSEALQANAAELEGGLPPTVEIELDLLEMFSKELPEIAVLLAELMTIELPKSPQFWLQAKGLMDALAFPFQDFTRYKGVMTHLRDFVDEYEKVEPSDLTPLLIQLREDFYYAGLMEGGIQQEQDAPPIIEYVLGAIGCTVFLEVNREAKKVEENGEVVSFVGVEAQPSQILQVPITGDGVSLQDLMDSFMAVREWGNEENAWRATHPQTAEEVSFTKWEEKVCIREEPPEYLQIQLKRFKFTPQHVRQKIDSKVEMGDLEVDLSALFELEEGKSARYRIVSGVIHEGSCNGGHYYAVTEKAGQWFQCNDSLIQQEEDPQKLLSEAYVFFLQKIEEPPPIRDRRDEPSPKAN